MNDRELMQQALDALKIMRPACFAENTLKTADTAIAALRDRLAQPAQEPVAWRFGSGTWLNREVHWRYIDTLEGAEGLRGLEPLYTTPPQRQWVGLTEIEIVDTEAEELTSASSETFSFARAIEYKLKQKNT